MAHPAGPGGSEWARNSRPAGSGIRGGWLVGEIVAGDTMSAQTVECPRCRMPADDPMRFHLSVQEICGDGFHDPGQWEEGCHE